ncbi:hypothetical protein ACP4OV_013860 [Aristida adscensionis]
MSVLIATSVGDMVVDLHTDLCPLATKNFLKLCKLKYYNGCLFHKVDKDFLAQTGDPTGTGTGGDSVYKFLYGDQARFFDDAIHPQLRHSKIGTLAMASAGKNRNASQFYITLRDDVDYLDVFGMVAEGFGTLAKINEAFFFREYAGKLRIFVLSKRRQQNGELFPPSLAPENGRLLDRRDDDKGRLMLINEAYVDDKGRPFKDIRIKHTYVLVDPFDDPPQLAELIPKNSPTGKPRDEIAEARLEDSWVPLDEKVAPKKLEEMIHAKEAHRNAVVLEILGDIPDAGIKPPDNVLFVSKLHPVTQDEDLYIVFSRVGPVTSAQIIRDYKTGDSLCYAFIEFETEEACVRAHSEMENYLIDNQRISVDFSQSVAKLWRQFRLTKRNAKKGGCFKCGAPDHLAGDCDQDAERKNKVRNYALKEENTRRGGNHRRSYDQVFGEDSADKKGEENDDRRKVQRVDDRRSELPPRGACDRSNREEKRNTRCSDHDDWRPKDCHTHTHDRSSARYKDRYYYSKHQSRREEDYSYRRRYKSDGERYRKKRDDGHEKP